MSRAIHMLLRPAVVWVAVSAAAATSALALPGAWRSARSPSVEVADLLVAACALALAVSSAWLWVVTTVTVAELLAGHRPRWQGGATRRLVLVACGVAVVAGPALPAGATGEGADVLVGLSLPDRATAPAARSESHRPARDAQAPDSYVVRPGDSLWSIARTHPARDLTVDERWRAIWRANHDVVGDDPDLILPGQALRLPPHPTPSTTPPTDGDR